MRYQYRALTSHNLVKFESLRIYANYDNINRNRYHLIVEPKTVIPFLSILVLINFISLEGIHI